MEGILIDYHLLFIGIAVMSFFFTILLLFVEPDRKTAIGAMIVIGFNNNICWINVFGFLAVNVYGFDSVGILISNPTADMFPLWPIFFGLGLVNVGLLFYIPLVLMKHPLSKEFEKEPEPAFKGRPPQRRIGP